MTSEGLGKMFEAEFADTCAEKFPLVSMGGRVEGLACADPEARTPIGASGNYNLLSKLRTQCDLQMLSDECYIKYTTGHKNNDGGRSHLSIYLHSSLNITNEYLGAPITTTGVTSRSRSSAMRSALVRPFRLGPLCQQSLEEFY